MDVRRLATRLTFRDWPGVANQLTNRCCHKRLRTFSINSLYSTPVSVTGLFLISSIVALSNYRLLWSHLILRAASNSC
jgi:hypothetical protein